jgi:hypothetical protein
MYPEAAYPMAAGYRQAVAARLKLIRKVHMNRRVAMLLQGFRAQKQSNA